MSASKNVSVPPSLYGGASAASGRREDVDVKQDIHGNGGSPLECVKAKKMANRLTGTHARGEVPGWVE